MRSACQPDPGCNPAGAGAPDLEQWPAVHTRVYPIGTRRFSHIHLHAPACHASRCQPWYGHMLMRHVLSRAMSAYPRAS
jgi:hypothetical protein